jgi:manganese transport protein
VQILAWIITSILVYLNISMVFGQASDFFISSDSIGWKSLIIAGGLFFISLLLISLLYPLLRKKAAPRSLELHKTPGEFAEIVIPTYRKIAVALDFSKRDQELIAHAISLATAKTEIVVLHIVESASAKILGIESDDLETRKDQENLDRYVTYIKQKGFAATSMIGFRNRTEEIPRLVKETNADLLVIGSHGHSGVKDWIYGETINAVRHKLKIPVLIV